MIINPQLDPSMILFTWLQFFMFTTVFMFYIFFDRNNKR